MFVRYKGNSLHSIFYAFDFYVYEVGKRLFPKYHNICISINNHKLPVKNLNWKFRFAKTFSVFSYIFFDGLIEKFDLGEADENKDWDNFTFVDFLLFKVLLKGLIWEIDENKSELLSSCVEITRESRRPLGNSSSPLLLLVSQQKLTSYSM